MKRRNRDSSSFPPGVAPLQPFRIQQAGIGIGGLWRLKKQVDGETTYCWLIVAIAAIAAWPLGSLVGYSFILIFSALIPIAFDQYTSGNPYLEMLQSLGMAASTVVSFAAGLVVPIAIVLWAIYEHRRHYRFAVSDLIWTDMPLFLLHEEYGAIIEQAKRERYRPNPLPVHLGESLVDRLNHFACYYKQYRQLSRPIGEVRVPLVMGHNCWLEGILLLVSCCASYFCVGVILLIPLLIHAVSNRPRQIAIKQAVVHFFEGRFDHQFPQA